MRVVLIVSPRYDIVYVGICCDFSQLILNPRSPRRTKTVTPVRIFIVPLTACHPGRSCSASPFAWEGPSPVSTVLWKPLEHCWDRRKDIKLEHLRESDVYPVALALALALTFLDWYQEVSILEINGDHPVVFPDQVLYCLRTLCLEFVFRYQLLQRFQIDHWSLSSVVFGKIFLRNSHPLILINHV